MTDMSYMFKDADAFNHVVCLLQLEASFNSAIYNVLIKGLIIGLSCVQSENL